VPLVVLGLPAMLVRTFENWEVLCRRDWRRPRLPLLQPARTDFPGVSVHVPAHAEPPEVVIATLDSLARLDYPNLEVLVIDNNTADPALWQPVEAYCIRLGKRFRFLHVEGITGAKAGALNFALPHTDATAELIAVVDADYQVERDFLLGTVGYFDDPAIGFVQGPHAYRGWEDSAYLRLCNWEYAYFFATGMVSLNERDAAITVGTMCVVRRRALEGTGGWAEWCLTEDSELAVRIHAVGYSPVYLNHIYGRGLIPQSFAGYKQQRFRWSGPTYLLRWLVYRVVLGAWGARNTGCLVGQRRSGPRHRRGQPMGTGRPPRPVEADRQVPPGQTEGGGTGSSAHGADLRAVVPRHRRAGPDRAAPRRRLDHAGRRGRPSGRHVPGRPGNGRAGRTGPAPSQRR